METIENKRSSRLAQGWLRLILVGGIVTCSASAMAAGDIADAAPSAVPAAPTHLVGFPTVTSDLAAAVVLSWHRSLGATSYEVYMGTTPGGESSTPVATVLGPRTEIKELAGFTTYYFTVKAHNHLGDSPASAEISVTTGCDISCE
jgi:hypothetical protein